MPRRSFRLGKLFQTPAARPSPTRRPALNLISLEDRTVPATTWLQGGGGSGHTNYADVTVNPAAISDAWTAPLNYVSSATGSWAERGVAVDDTHVYRTDLDGYAFNGTYHVIAYDAATGAQVWNKTFIGNAFEGVGEPSVSNGIVYVNRSGHSGNSGGTIADYPHLYGLDANTGATVVQATYSAQWASNERPVIAGNQLFDYDGYYGGMSAWTTGTLGRQWNVGGSIYDDHPVSAVSTYFVFAYGNQVFLRSNGAQQAPVTHPLGFTLTNAMVTSQDGVIYTFAGTVGGVQKYGVAAFDGTPSHNLLWTAYTNNAVAAKAVGNGLVAVTTSQQLVLLDQATGNVVRTWQAPTGENLSQDMVLTRSHAFVESTRSGAATVYAVNLATGQSEWSYTNTQGGEVGSPYMEMAFGGGRLLLSADPFVRAFNASADRPPVAVDDSATTDEDTAVTVNVLGNDSDPDGDAITVTAAGNPGHGTAKVNGDGTITYTPAANYNGTDTFTYTISDGKGGTASATVTVAINPVNDPPVAAGWQFGTNEDTPLNDYLRASDVDGDALTFAVVNSPAHGALQLNLADGTFTFTPAADYNGTDFFDFKVNDGTVDSNVARVYVTVRPVNDPPVARDDSYSTDEDTPLTVTAPGVLGNDSDVDSSTLTAVLVSGPGKGNLTLNADGSFTYTPNANANGTDSFTYKANDGSASGNVATVTITVNAVNDPPVAGNDSYTTDEDTPLTVTAPGVLGNDSDVDSSTLTAVLVSGPGKGNLTLNADGSFTYTPNANANGTDTFTYKASDGSAFSNTATVTITVNPVQDPPVAAAGPDQTANEAATVSFDGRGSYDVDGDTLSYAWTFGDGGSATGATPSHAYADNGTYTVTLTVNDGHGHGNSDTAIVTVKNVAPTAGVSGPATGVRGQTRTFTFTAADPSVVDQSAGFGYSINWGDGSGVQTVQGAGSVSVDHTYTAGGSFAVVATATDKDAGTSTPASRSVTISAVELQGTTLVVGGTTGADTILIAPSDTTGNLTVTINGAGQGTFKPTGSIVVYAQAGNDTVVLQTAKVNKTTVSVAVPAFLFGGAGNDTLDSRGSVADNVLVGGDGADTIWAGGGQDILLGGLGADVLHGGDGDDILIGGNTDFDTDLAALTALIGEWGRTDLGYQGRIDHLTGATAGGKNGAYRLTSATVHNDAAVDQLSGEGGQDWFLFSATDVLNDKKNNERATQV